MTEPASTTGPVYDLPETVVLDPFSSALMAVYSEIEKQTGQTGAMVALDPEPITRAALAAGGAIPRVPEWIDAPRSIGGTTQPGAVAPDPEVTVDLGAEAGTVRVGVALAVVKNSGKVRDHAATTEVPVTDAEQWALNVLSVVAEVRARQAGAETPAMVAAAARRDR